MRRVAGRGTLGSCVGHVAAAAWLLATLLGLALSGCAPAPSLSGLLLLTVDTLRADRLGAYGSHRELTPRLDGLARESLVFEAAYAPAPFTFPSLASLFTGRYPGELGIRSNRSAIPEDVPTLATALRERGWRTAAVISNFVLREKTGLAEGFEVYDDTMLQTERVRKWPERVARFTTDAALERAQEIASTGAPWLLWVHYQDPHGPYTPPPGTRETLLAAAREGPDGERVLERGANSGLGGIPPYQVLDERRDAAFYRAGYDAEVAYIDREIGRLLDGLGDRGLLQRAGVVFAADHGEALGEHDYWFAHGHHLTDELVRVPLFLKLPDVAPGRRADVVSLVDLFPTLLAHALDAPEPDFGSGRDLLAAGAEAGASVPFMATLTANAFPRYAIVEGGYKLVLSHRDGVWRSQLYRSGHEEVDLAPAAPQLASRLRTRLDELRRRYHRGTPERRQELGPEEESQLRALGYVEEGT